MKLSQPIKNKTPYPLEDHPKLIDLLTELAAFTQKWKTPKIANSVDVSKQGLQYHINKKKGKNA